MKQVLVVDDEEDMLWMLQRNLNKGMQDVEVLSARSSQEALTVLQEQPINLVITDINMPGMNGLELLAEINDNYPKTGVIIMTAYPSSTYENQAMMNGSLRYIEKPFDIKEVRKIVTDVLHVGEGFQGSVGAVDLLDIVQFNGLSGATSALKVTTRDKEGMIFFKDGAVVHAMTDKEAGEDAFYTILGFNGGSLENTRGVEPPTVTISTSNETLLFKAALANDENLEQSPEPQDGSIIAPGNSLSLPAEIDKPELVFEQDTKISEEADQENLPRNFTEDFEMTEIQKILAEFTNIEGVHTACLVGRDGFLLDSIARTGIDAEMIGAIASSGFGSTESMGNQLEQGNLKMSMFEFDNGPVMFAPVGDEAFLVIVADADTNLGWIRISIKKNSTKIKAAAAL